MKIIYLPIFLALFSITTTAEEVVLFTVKHITPTGKPLENPPFKYMWYYRTEIKNISDIPLRIIWFEGYLSDSNQWYGANVMNKPLRSKEFSQWYTEGAKIINGVIPPGETAVCDVNFHGSNEPNFIRAKWSYLAIDNKGNDYLVESEVERAIVLDK